MGKERAFFVRIRWVLAVDVEWESLIERDGNLEGIKDDVILSKVSVLDVSH